MAYNSKQAINTSTERHAYTDSMRWSLEVLVLLGGDYMGQVSYIHNQGCRGDGISIPIPIPYPQESPLESPWESPYPRNPK